MRGNVDVLNEDSVQGWAAGDSSQTVLLDVIVGNELVGRVPANGFRQDLQAKNIKHDGIAGFCFCFPTALRQILRAGAPVLVQPVDADRPLPGPKATTALASRFVGDWEVVRESALVHIEIDAATATAGGMELDVTVWARAVPELRWRFNEESCEPAQPAAERPLARDARGVGLAKSVHRLVVPAPRDQRACLLAAEGEPGTDLGVGALASFPTDLAERGVPAIEAIRRVVGPNAQPLGYLLSGYTIAQRIAQLVLRHLDGTTGRHSRQVLDWGCGPGRVLEPMRALLGEDWVYQGCDVDSFTLEAYAHTHTHTHMHPALELKVSRPLPPLPYENDTFDVVYGISIFTHLTEVAEILWLAELRRVLVPGGLLIVTTHNLFSIFLSERYDLYFAAAIAELEQFGRSDVMHDLNLGTKIPNGSLYRSTFHRHDYIRQNWSEYFDIVAHHPAGNILKQDLWVLRKPAGAGALPPN